MPYQIVLPLDTEAPEEVDLEYDTPRGVRQCLDYLRRRLGDFGFMVQKDGRPISPEELEGDEKSYEIQIAIEEAQTLPASYHPGRTGDSDIGVTLDGMPRGVRRPRNPEDDFS